MTITELAETAGTSEPTVVRLCRKIGLQGFMDLRLNLIIGITVHSKSPLRKICDIHLPVYSQETAIWLAFMAPRIVQIALLDLLFVPLATKKLGVIKKRLEKVKRSLIDKRY